MFKIDGAGNVNGAFVNEDSATNRPPTEVTSDWLNAVQTELVNLAGAAGLALDKNDSGQLVKAVAIAVRLQSAAYASAGGTADVLTGTYAPVVPALVNGLTLYVRAASANATTIPTFSPNGLVAKTIVKGNGLALVAGDIAGAGHWVELQYDLTLDKWVLLNPATGVNLLPLFGSSLSTNGYQKILGGFILQWGSYTSVTSGTTGALNFPIAFPNACRLVMPMASNNIAASSMASAIVSASQFTITSAYGAPQNTFVIAIGS